MDFERIYQDIPDNQVLGKDDLLAIAQKTVEIQPSSIFWMIRKMLQVNMICHIGRNQYRKISGNGQRVPCQYERQLSEKAKKIQIFLKNEYPQMCFQVWELVQYNDFLNHQIARNTIFVEVESMLEDSVYETLREMYRGQVLLKPNPEVYNTYAEHNTIVVSNLVTEAPKSKSDAHTAALEKLLVDLFKNKLLLDIISASELDFVLENAFSMYQIDKSKLFRYARRRNAESAIRARLDRLPNTTWIDRS